VFCARTWAFCRPLRRLAGLLPPSERTLWELWPTPAEGFDLSLSTVVRRPNSGRLSGLGSGASSSRAVSPTLPRPLRHPPRPGWFRARSGSGARGVPPARAVVIPMPALPDVQVSVESEPAGASVFRSGATTPLGQTPVTLSLPRGSEPVRLQVIKSGFLPSEA